MLLTSLNIRCFSTTRLDLVRYSTRLPNGVNLLDCILTNTSPSHGSTEDFSANCIAGNPLAPEIKTPNTKHHQPATRDGCDPTPCAALRTHPLATQSQTTIRNEHPRRDPKGISSRKITKPLRGSKTRFPRQSLARSRPHVLPFSSAFLSPPPGKGKTITQNSPPLELPPF
jgi:hypothetical protein